MEDEALDVNIESLLLYVCGKIDPIDGPTSYQRIIIIHDVQWLLKGTYMHELIL